jgi:hypothetical protein
MLMKTQSYIVHVWEHKEAVKSYMEELKQSFAAELAAVELDCLLDAMPCRPPRVIARAF